MNVNRQEVLFIFLFPPYYMGIIFIRKKMFKKFVIFIVFAFTCNFIFAQVKKVQRPKLVVGIVVDQMRWDYLYRYYDRFGDGGFIRLLKDGFPVIIRLLITFLLILLWGIPLSLPAPYPLLMVL